MSGPILVSRLDSWGDVLLAGPAVRAAAGSGRPVHLLCGPRGREAADLLPGLAGVIEWPAPWMEPEPCPVMPCRHYAELAAEVSRRGITDALILGSSHQSPLPLALLLRWAGVTHIGAVSDEHGGSLLDVRIPGDLDPDLHEVERNLAVAAAMGFGRPDDVRLRVTVAASAADGRTVVVHPGASEPARTLAPPRWGQVASALARDGWRVLVTGRADEAHLTAAVAGDEPGVLDVGGRTSLRELAELIGTASAYVGGNTGATHLAAAMGTPSVVAFAPTVPLRRWHPWRVPHVVLGRQDVDCAGCRRPTCPLPRQACLDGVEVDHVVDAVASVVAFAREPLEATA